MKKFLIIIIIVVFVAQVKAQNTTKFTEINVGVSEMGSATANVPINCPTGRKGIQPNLSITFNSNIQNGILGKGFMLNGISSICRGGSNFHTDNTVQSGITHTNQDKFFLDGNKLILVSGVYGVAGSVYRTENDIFARVTYTGNGFLVETKEGGLLKYTIQFKLISINIPLAYYLEYTFDKFGNYIKYSYNNESGEIVLDKIEYNGFDGSLGGFKTGSTTSTIATNLLIKLNYISINNSLDKFNNGGTKLSNKRLQTIEIKRGTTLLNTYTFLFSSTNKNEKLNGISQTNKEAVSFSWSGNETNQSVNGQLYTQMDYKTDYYKTVGDFNGDGKTDLLTVNGVLNLISLNPLDPKDPNNPWLYQFNKLLGTENYLSIFTTGSDNKMESQPLVIKQLPYDNIANISIVDFDADGKDDIIFQIANISTNSNTVTANYKYKIFKMVLNEQLQMVNLIPFQKQLPEFNFTYTASLDDIFRANIVSPYFIDMDGDGLPDLVQKSDQFLTNTTTNLAFYFSTDNYETLRTLGSGYELSGLNAFLPMDFNGNGKKDIFISTSTSGFYMGVKNGIIEYDYASKSFTTSVELIENPTDIYSFRTGDFNGDGNSDILYMRLFEFGPRGRIAFSNGKDKFMEELYPYWGESIGTELQIADFNSDGMDDILVRHDNTGLNTCVVNFSNGYNDFTEGTSTLNRNVIQNPSRFGSYFLGDYDGDGKKDVLMFESQTKDYGFTNYVIDYHKTNSSNLTQISQPKKSYEFTYDVITQYSGYKRTLNPNVLNNCIGLNIPIKVVTNLIVTTINSENEYFTYYYKDLIYNRHGRGLMGFMETCKTSQKGNMNNPLRVQINKYAQENALAHQLNLIVTKNYNSGTVDNTNTIIPASLILERNFEYRTIRTTAINGVNFSFMSISIETNYITKNVKGICYDYDLNGNLIMNSAIYYKLGDPDVTYSSATSYTYNQLDTWIPATIIASNNYRKRKNQTTIHTPIAYSYQPNSSILKSITKYGVEEYFEFDAYGNRIRKGYNYLQNLTGGYTKNTYIQYDAAHHFVDYVQNDAGHKTIYTYDKDREKLVSETAPNGLITNYEYDIWGRLIKTIHPNGNFTATNYDLNDNSGNYKIEEYNNLGNRATKTYNWKMMLLKEEKNTKFDANNPNKMATKNYNYNSNGLLVTETNWYDAGNNNNGLLNTTYTYDVYDRLLSVWQNNEELKKYVYEDHKLTYTDGRRASKITNFDALDMAISVEEKGNNITYTYSSNNLPIAINTNGNTITYEYNDNGTLTKQCDPNSGCTNLEYNGINELTRSTDANGNAYNYSYDNLGKLTQKTGINNAIYTYEYYEINLHPDLNLPKTQTLTENGIIKNKIDYTYNDLAELIQTQELAANNLTYTTTYNYTDDSGKHRLNSVNYPNIELTYEYDNNNNLQIIGDGNQSFIWKNELETIDGRLLQVKYGNNYLTEYTYNTNLNLASIKSNNINTPSNVAMHVGYNFDLKSNNLMRKDDIKNANYETFEYDDLDRLTKSTAYLPNHTPINYEVNYDNIGNITQKHDAGTFTYAGSKPHAVQSNSFVNSLSPVIIPTSFAEPQEITYTQSNKIATLMQGNKDLTINYGFNEQRIHTLIKENNITTTQIYYIASANMEIVNGAEITYLYANGQPFAYHKKSGEDKTINYLHLDYQGSIMAVTTQSGTIKEEHNYDVWGRPRTASTLAYVLPNPFGSGSDIRRGYTFHEHLEEFNLINMNGRMYDPLLARFLNADPLIQDNTDAQNYNRYSYVLNNPTKYTDPSGYAYNGFAASNAAYERMLEQYSYDMVMQREMDFLSFKEMVKMNENFGGGNGGTGNPSGIEGSGYVESDSGPYKIPDSERNEMKKNGMTPEYGMKITPRSGIAKDLGKVSEFCGNFTQSGRGSVYGAAVPIALTAAVVDGPIPIGDVVGAVILAGATAYDATQRTFVTYTMRNAAGQVYAGRTSGYGDPYRIMMNRYYGHHMRALGYGNPVLDRAVQGYQGYPAIRGREQQLIDYYGGVGSPGVGNAIRGVGYYTDFGQTMHNLSNLYFTPLAPYTGFWK